MNLLAKPMPQNSERNLELIDGVYPEFNVEDYLAGKVAPVFLVQH